MHIPPKLQCLCKCGCTYNEHAEMQDALIRTGSGGLLPRGKCHGKHVLREEPQTPIEGYEPEEKLVDCDCPHFCSRLDWRPRRRAYA